MGVGPGDPELMTQKALRLIRENDVIAVPGKTAEGSMAYRIAAAMIPELKDKELVPVYMPMTRDRDLLEKAHREGAELLESYLDRGENVVYITLGDPTIYCTFSYLQNILEEDGYTVEMVPGITSFCASASRLRLPLVEGNEPLHVVPASQLTAEDLNRPGTYVIMKSGKSMSEVKELLRRSGKVVTAVENCGMADEKIYRSVDDVPDDAGYYTLIIAK